MLAYLRLAGFRVETHDASGEPIAYTAADGQMQGHVDGVIAAGPAMPGCAWPALWENKAVNAESWTKFTRYGVQAERPVYYAQAQVYMAYLGLERCLFTAINRDTAEIHAEVIEFNAAAAQRISDSGVHVILSDGPDEFPRIARDETDFRCKFCAWRRRCWAPEVDRRINTPAPSWLNKGN